MNLDWSHFFGVQFWIYMSILIPLNIIYDNIRKGEKSVKSFERTVVEATITNFISYSIYFILVKYLICLAV